MQRNDLPTFTQEFLTKVNRIGQNYIDKHPQPTYYFWGSGCNTNQEPAKTLRDLRLTPEVDSQQQAIDLLAKAILASEKLENGTLKESLDKAIRYYFLKLYNYEIDNKTIQDYEAIIRTITGSIPLPYLMVGDLPQDKKQMLLVFKQCLAAKQQDWNKKPNAEALAEFERSLEESDATAKNKAEKGFQTPTYDKK